MFLTKPKFTVTIWLSGKLKTYEICIVQNKTVNCFNNCKHMPYKNIKVNICSKWTKLIHTVYLNGLYRKGFYFEITVFYYLFFLLELCVLVSMVFLQLEHKMLEMLFSWNGPKSYKATFSIRVICVVGIIMLQQTLWFLIIRISNDTMIHECPFWSIKSDH